MTDLSSINNVDDIASSRMEQAVNESGLSRREVSKRAGYCSTYVSKIINKLLHLNPQAAREIATVLSVSPAWLIGLSDYKTESEIYLAGYNDAKGGKAIEWN